MQSFVIIGLSTFGRYLAQYLAEREFDVVVIDSDESKVEEVKPFVNKGIIANAKDKETLNRLGLKESDAVIVSLGDKMDESLLVVLYLNEIGAENVYVKVQTEEHAKIINMIGNAEIIFPERDSAFKLAQRIDNPNILDYVPLAEGYSVIDWSPSRGFIGKSIGELDLQKKYGVQVISVEETVPERVKLIPKADYVIKDSDILVIVGKNEDIQRLKNAE